MSVPSDRFCSLKQMLQLVKFDIRIGIINKCVKEFHSFPNSELFAIKLKKLSPFFHNEIVRLILMVQSVEFTHRITGGICVISKFLFRLGRFVWFWVTTQYIVFPLLNAFQ